MQCNQTVMQLPGDDDEMRRCEMKRERGTGERGRRRQGGKEGEKVVEPVMREGGGREVARGWAERYTRGHKPKLLFSINCLVSPCVQKHVDMLTAHSCMHTQAYAHTHTHAQTHTRTHKDTHTHTDTHTQLSTLHWFLLFLP